MKIQFVIALSLLLSSGIAMAEKKKAVTLEQHNGHEYVDMGLTNEEGKTIYWATQNVGADQPEDCGFYFAWGDTDDKNKSYAYSNCYKRLNDVGEYPWEALNDLWDNYKYVADGYKSWQGLTKYTFPDGRTSLIAEESGLWYKNNKFVGDNKRVLDIEDDAVNSNWGGEWRMPTEKEFEQLLTECKWVWKHRHGVPGYLVKSKKTRGEIFLPITVITDNLKSDMYYEITGQSRNDDAETYERSFYWTSSLSWEENSKAVTVFFDFYERKIAIDYRFVLMPVRGVYVK